MTDIVKIKKYTNIILILYSIKEILHRSLIKEPVGVNTYYVETNQIWKWTTSIKYNIIKKIKEYDKDKEDNSKKNFNQNEYKILAIPYAHKF
jgi:hypothetical protein